MKQHVSHKNWSIFGCDSVVFCDIFFFCLKTMASLFADPHPFNLTEVTLDSIAAVYFPRLGSTIPGVKMGCKKCRSQFVGVLAVFLVSESF